MINKLGLIVVMLIISACGGQQQRVAGIDQDTMLIIRSEKLVGLSLAIGDGYARTIESKDLTPFELGVLGAKDREEEHLQTMTVKVDPGERRVTVSNSSQVLYDKRLYLSQGQTREIRIRR